MKKAIALLLVLAASAFAFWRYRTLPPEDELRLYGNVDIRQVSLAFETGGRVAELFAEEGDRVFAGQILGRVDVEGLLLERAKTAADIAIQEENARKMHNGSRPDETARARATLRSAQVSLNQAKRDLARMKKMRRDNSISQQDLENAQTIFEVRQAARDEAERSLALIVEGYREEDIAMAEAQLRSARAALAVLDYRISRGKLTAPCDAVVSSRLLEPGDMASADTPVFLLSLSSPKWIRAYTSEKQLGRIRQGMKADILTDSFPDPVPGQVGYISSSAEFTPKSVQTEELRPSLLYEVRVIANDPDDKLRLGMPVTVLLQENPPHVQ